METMNHHDRLDLSTIEFIKKAKRLLAEKEDESLFREEKEEIRYFLISLISEPREDVINAIKILVVDKINKLLSFSN